MKLNIFESQSTCMEASVAYHVCLYMNHYTKTTVVCCNPTFSHGTLHMDHHTTLHVSVGLTLAHSNNTHSIHIYSVLTLLL